MTAAKILADQMLLKQLESCKIYRTYLYAICPVCHKWTIIKKIGSVLVSDCSTSKHFKYEHEVVAAIDRAEAV